MSCQEGACVMQRISILQELLSRRARAEQISLGTAGIFHTMHQVALETHVGLQNRTYWHRNETAQMAVNSEEKPYCLSVLCVEAFKLCKLY